MFKWIGPDHKIVVDAYDDPKVAGVTCYVSRAKTGGIKGALGLAEDKAEASIACVQVGPIRIAKPLPKQEDMFTERISLIFKKLRVVRMVDTQAQCAGLPDLFGPGDRGLAAEQRGRGGGGRGDQDPACAERRRRFVPLLDTWLPRRAGMLCWHGMCVLSASRYQPEGRRRR